uniref:Transposase-associated domain-containing protein n=1 Tax=Chenopodium quinoa TaxID=63459 RepID=A0A803LSU7_CHEQI
MNKEEDDEPKILCPCMKCVNKFWFPREEIFSHLIANRFNKRYKVWSFHGEGFTTGSSSTEDGHQCDNQNTLDNMDEMINDIFRDIIGGSSCDAKELWKGPDEMRLYLLKFLNGWSNSSFDKLMKLQCDAFPFAKLPTSFHHAKKMVKNLGLNYKRIDACPNDCMLYWKEHANDKSCHVCKASRWKLNEKKKEEGALPDHGVLAKVLRYFPVKSRL